MELKVLDSLKANGFRWSFSQGLWYTRYSESAMQFAQSLGG